MKRTKVKIHVSASLSPDGSVVMLSDSLVKKWKLSQNPSVSLCFGSAKQEVKVIPVTQAGMLRLSDTLAAKWGVKHGDSLCLQYKSASGSLHLGPLIGVMVSRANASAGDKLFGTTTAFCHEMTEACKIYGAAVFFCTPEDLKTAGDTVKGWHYAGRWIRSTFPVPHVLYNRLTSRRYENYPHVQQFVSQARSKHRTIMFNEKYLNKSEVFDALRKEAGLQTYLPESHLLRNFATLKSMCSKYASVFLKPITGSLGKGIIRIRRSEGGTYIAHFTGLNGTRKQVYRSLTQLYSAISGKVKTGRHQIQQGLNLIQAGDRPIDFRALVQRDDTGSWTVTSIVGRIAGNHQFVSNLARGGTLCTVREALARAGASASGAARLKRAALQIAKGIETQVEGHFAELGVDLALDTSGRVWLLEVNSKPSKDDNTPLNAERKIRPSVKTVVQYARHAAKF
ncbi:YheC/YheD family endospore coat-associated protein [Paenibacillus silviterrae]|uniref:YheC/YheD family endospore coat-associated protein n=1 Tax=Paenibacillus silviterrae TaxID=3242194 RepID=UPI0025431A83|nr:YheC/YheD family protein [Paenibacillus chinjuensis]